MPCVSSTSGASVVLPPQWCSPSVYTINFALYGVSWVQKKVGQPQVSRNPFVTQVADAARRILARPPERKKPLTADQVMPDA